MKLNRATLRNLILEELRLLKEGPDFDMKIAGRGEYGLDYEEKPDKFVITAFYKNGEKLEKGFGKELGLVLDSSPINRLESQFKVKIAKGKTVERELS